MKKFIKKTLSIFLCVLVAATSFVNVAMAGSDSFYPEGIGEAQALGAVSSTDKLLKNVLEVYQNTSLTDLVKPQIYNSDTLSSMLLGVYRSLELNKKELQMIGVDASTKAVAKALRQYKEVSTAIEENDSWATVSLKNINWGVNDKEGFAEAMGAILSPFNELLYTLLCDGNFVIGGLITINGEDGYQNAIVPLLRALGCEIKLDQLRFIYEADQNKNNMVKNIMLPILELLEKALANPADTLTYSLPGFAYFSESGRLQESIDSLASPITKNKLVELAVFLKILDLKSLKIDAESLINTNLQAFALKNNIRLQNVSLKNLAQCGSGEGDAFVPNKAMAYVDILRWAFESLKLNEKRLIASIENSPKGSIPMDAKAIEGILKKDADAVIGTVIRLFEPNEIPKPKELVYPEITPFKAQYTANLGEAKMKRVLKGIDPLLDDFAKEGGKYSTIDGQISAFIYRGDNVSSALLGIYSSLEKADAVTALKMLNIDASPKGIASTLEKNGYTNIAKKLRNYKAWEDVSLKGTSWGFSTGSRRGFQNAMNVILKPLNPVWGVIFAEKDIVLLDSIKIKGADGYNTAVIPLLEALGCNEKSILSYKEYKENGNYIDNILNPLFDLVDRFCEKPIFTLTEILPNIVYFLNSDSLDIVLENLMRPVDSLTKNVASLYETEVKLPKLSEKVKLDEIVKDATSNMGFKIAEFDLNKVSGMGEIKEKTSKAVIDGKKLSYKYVEANQLDVLMSMVRVLAKTLKLPGNDELLMSSMGGGGNSAFDAYSSNLTDKFKTMNEDELIEWLYQLFFKERVKAELVVDEEYQPTIIYTPEEKSHTWVYFVGGYFGVATIVAIILIINRKKLYGNYGG